MYTLNGTQIKAPKLMQENNNTQYAANRTLSGNNTRDYFGSNKRVWTLQFSNLTATDYATINTLYQTYLANESPMAFVVSEGNYVVTSTNVHIDFPDRTFSIGGTTYLSDCTLILTEA